MGFLGKKRNILIVSCCIMALVIATAYFFVKKTDIPFFQKKETLVEIPEGEGNEIENGIHVPTGLINAKGMQEVVNNCTTCHSAKLVMQNRMTREQWLSTIRWMQKTQNLWPLGENEKIIVNYLVENYPPLQKGRREELKDIEWYPLQGK